MIFLDKKHCFTKILKQMMFLVNQNLKFLLDSLLAGWRESFKKIIRFIMDIFNIYFYIYNSKIIRNQKFVQFFQLIKSIMTWIRWIALRLNYGRCVFFFLVSHKDIIVLKAVSGLPKSCSISRILYQLKCFWKVSIARYNIICFILRWYEFAHIFLTTWISNPFLFKLKGDFFCRYSYSIFIRKEW